ncbi:putative bifunctional diguanylate cyclase/phosphodiesterase [Rehaibacterium terrae]|jgi:diguanylate cyclase (GGDEF)-like protein|uniref:Diguanylate cyclase (GGDEF)-like protein n=1 Tax=Rehaibacterium terrae TaxID=1341696 RepID=A0A7W7V8P1_9GAMM|nr:EAL domain-containing protein [Rehaibacterium terrae]MBB5014685.1 diguanylate cyclase (GGDEF)-like protein [Rehaibacterium terrae]
MDEAAALRRRGLRFGTKLVLLLAGLVVGLQVAGWLTVRVAVERSIKQQLEAQLRVGEKVWNRLHETKLRQLLERVSVLAEDFGFREAIALQDGPTLESVLESAHQRIGTPFGAVLAPDAHVLATRLHAGVALPESALRGLVAEARKDGFSAGIVALSGQPVSYALVPVFAPDLVGWLALGQPFGTGETDELAEITGLAPNVVLRDMDHWRTVQGVEVGSADLAALDTGALRIALEPEDGGGPRLALRLSAESLTPVYLVIEADRGLAMAPYAGLQAQVLVLSLAAAALAMLAAALIGRRVSGPVSELARAASRIRRGEYGATLPVEGSDEFALLAEAFNAMQQGIAEREQRILHQAGHDALTGLPNRERALNLLSERLADPALRQGTLAMIDLRHFHEVNDQLGYVHGDLALIEVANRLRAAVRGDDLLARLGGDEFLVALWTMDAEQAHTRFEALAELLAAPMDVQGVPLRLEVDLGLVPFARLQDGSLPDARTLLRRVEIANQCAKREGRRIGLYREGMDERHLRQLAIVGELRNAIEGDQFSLHYQPKVDLRTRRVRHVEALLRWTHPQLGRIGPDEFIPLAERAGLIGALTHWVIDHAFAELAAWRTAGFDHGVAINLSAIDLADPNLASTVLDRLQHHRVTAGDIILEVTESAVLADMERAVQTLKRLRSEGFRVSVDDFGTGQSSLAQLKRLPADELKIDKSFVLQLAPGTDDERIVQSIVQLGHALGIKVVAEGLENEIGLEVLLRLGCDVAQGYHFSRPLPCEALLDWLRRRQEQMEDHAA